MQQQSPLLLQQRTIISLCDFSGNWSKPYRDAGYNVVQVDLKHGNDVRMFQHYSTAQHSTAQLCAWHTGRPSLYSLRRQRGAILAGKRQGRAHA